MMTYVLIYICQTRCNTSDYIASTKDCSRFKVDMSNFSTQVFNKTKFVEAPSLQHTKLHIKYRMLYKQLGYFIIG